MRVLNALFVPAQVARAAAQSSEILERESRGKAFSSRHLCGAQGGAGVGVFRQGGSRTTSRFVFEPGGVQNVDCRSKLSSHRIPGLDRSCNAMKIVIKC